MAKRRLSRYEEIRMFRAGARLALAASVVVAAGAVAVGLSAGGSSPVHGRGPLAAAVAVLPASTVNANFTYWESILRSRTVDDAFERDLSTRSAVLDSASDLKSVLKVGLGDIVWESYGQGASGEAAVLRLKRSMPSTAELRKRGYRLDDGVWRATGRLAGAETLVNAVAVMPRDDALVIGTKPGAVRAVRATILGTNPSLAGVRDVAEVTRAMAGVQTAFIQTSGLGCETTAVVEDAETGRQVAAAERRWGVVVPYTVIARGLRDGTHDQPFRVAMTFDSARVAHEQARIRADLSQGPFLGRSGVMDDVLRLRSAHADGSTVVLDYDHPADSEYLMTGHGPLLPASC